MNIFIKRMYQAEKPSKKEKHLRKIAFIIILDITSWFLPIEAVTKAFEPYHIEIVRAESVYAREQEEQYPVRLTAETVPQTDGVQVAHDRGSSPDSLIMRIKETFGDDADDMIRIAKCESHFNPNAVGDHKIAYTKDGKEYGKSYGIFQIRHLPGRPDPKELLDPQFNISYAKQILDRQGKNAWQWCNQNAI